LLIQAAAATDRSQQHIFGMPDLILFGADYNQPQPSADHTSSKKMSNIKNLMPIAAQRTTKLCKNLRVQTPKISKSSIEN